MPPSPDSFCHACGTAFAAGTAGYPRKCAGCGTEVYQNFDGYNVHANVALAAHDRSGRADRAVA